MAIINGTSAADRLVGTIFNDTINAFEGRDVIIGGQGSDSINGGDGFDTLNYGFLSNGITLKPAGEIDKGSLGIDNLFLVERVFAPVGRFNLIDASSATNDVSVRVSLTRNNLGVLNIPLIGNRNIRVNNFVSAIGTDRNDFLEGDNNDNFLSGLKGDDRFKGTLGFDSIDGGDGFDTVDYSHFTSAITLKPTGEIDKGGSSSPDSLFKIERVIGAANQSNKIDASSSNSAVLFANLPSRLLQVFGVPNAGTLNINVVNFTDVIGSQGNDAFIGTVVDNVIDGQNGDDFITASRGNDSIFGGDGFDTIDYSPLNVAVTILPSGVIKKGIAAGTDTAFQVERFIGAAGRKNVINASTASAGISLSVSLSSEFFDVRNVPGVGLISQFVENFIDVIGTGGDDFIEGSSGNNFLDGRGGNDSVFGGNGNDTLQGSGGADFITGEGGDDRINGTNSGLRGRNEIDSLTGGSGSDRFVLGDASGSFYKARLFPPSDFDPSGFGGFNQVAFISDLEASDRLELGRGETYRAEQTATGFDLYVSNSGRFDAVAGVQTTTFIGLPTGDFSLAAGQTLGVFVGA